MAVTYTRITSLFGGGGGGGGGGVTSFNSLTGAVTISAGTNINFTGSSGNNIQINATGGGSVTAVSVNTANGFAGTSSGGTTPALTLSTTVSGILFGNGTSVAAAVAGNFPTLNQNTTGTAANITATSNSTLTTLSALSLPYSQITGAPAAGITQLTGDVTAGPGSGSQAATLATVNSNVGSFTNANITVNAKGLITAASNGSSGTGTVTTVSVVSANGFAGTVATATTTPAITLTTTVTGILYGNGTSVAAAVAGNFPTLNQNTTGTASNVTSGTFTQGSVIFANSSGQLAQDNANFFWDDTHFALGIKGAPQANSAITLTNSSGAAVPIWAFNYGTGSTSGFRGDQARGTAGTPTATQSGDVLNFISGRGYGTSQFATTSTGVVQIVAEGAFTNTSNPTAVVIKTTPTGSVTSAIAATFNPNGQLTMPAFYTAYGTLVNDPSGNVTSTTPSTAGYVLTSNGASALPTFQPAPGIVSSFFASSQVTTNSTSITSSSFVTFSNSPAFTFTPSISGTYKVYAGVTLGIAASTGSSASVRIFKTSGTGTLLDESQGAISNSSSSANAIEDTAFCQSVYSLTAGTAYQFDVQGKTNGTSFADGALSPFYMFAELITAGASGTGVSSLNSLTGALNIVGGTNVTVSPSGSNITINSSGLNEAQVWARVAYAM